MSFSPAPQITEDGRVVSYLTASLLAQTCVYGANLAFLPYAASIIFRKRTGNGLDKFMRYAPLFAFTISTLYYGASLADVFVRLKEDFIDQVPLLERKGGNTSANVLNLFNAVVLLNLVLVDAILLWRAWVICTNLPKVKPFLVMANIFLALGFASASASILLRSLIIYDTSKQHFPGASRSLDVIQLLALGFSLLINILATGSIGWRHWDFRETTKTIKEFVGAQQDTTVLRALKILIESGFLYGTMTVIYLVASMIKLPAIQHHLGTRIFGVYVQLSSLYPALVMVIVHQEPSNPRQSVMVSRWEVRPQSPNETPRLSSVTVGEAFV